MNEPSLQQRRAAQALREVEKLKERGGYGKYVSYVKGLPAAILQNGLGQALATLIAAASISKPTDKRSEDEQAREILYSQLGAWLCRDDKESPYSQGDLMTSITQNDEDTYLRAQTEAFAYLSWLKKFAVAYLEEQSGQ
jgi:CRISPR-associated protein Cmr5